VNFSLMDWLALVDPLLPEMYFYFFLLSHKQSNTLIWYLGIYRHFPYKRPVLRISIGLNADPNQAFYLCTDLDPDPGPTLLSQKVGF
jgi:hypothetical protein